MRKYKYISMLVLGAVMMSACHDLDTYPSGSIITEDQRNEAMKDNPDEVAAAIVSGIYAIYYTYSGANAWGYPMLQLQNDCRTSQFVFYQPDSEYAWFSPCAKYQDNTASSAYSPQRWYIPYDVIQGANSLVQILDEVDPEETNNIFNYYKGQALGNRAFAYLTLVQTYQFTYVKNPDAPGVPIMTEKNMEEAVLKGAPRATVQEVYDQIFSDLDHAIALMEGNPNAVRADNRYVDLNVLYSFRARAALLTHNYKQAAEDAQRVISSGAFSPYSVGECMVPGFTDIQDHNVVWGTYQDEFTYNWLYNYSSFVCSWCYGYVTQNVWKLINSKDYYNIPEGDVRRLWWLSPDGPNVADYWKATTASGTTARQYIEEMNMPQYSVLKFAPYQNVIQTSVNASSMPTIRIEEMYMILAEAQALGGNLSQGVATLTNFVNTYRWSGSGSYQPTIASTDDFIDEIYFQRSIEFWGEGITYFDNMRFQRGINRKNSMWDSAYGQEIGVLGIAFDILPDNPVLIFQIPRGEIDNNKALTDADQNEPGQAAL